MYKRIFIGLLLITSSFSASALCIRNPVSGGQSWPPGWQPFDTTTGTYSLWNGSINGGSMNMPKFINLSSDLVQPIGTQIANGGPVPLRQYGEFNGLSPDDVLFVCSANEEGYLYEGYIINTNSAYHKQQVAVPEISETTYATRVRRVGWRALNVTTGQYFSDKWQLRPLTGLDRDIYGRILVKAKNFSDAQLEFYKLPYPTPKVGGGTVSTTTATSFSTFDPFGYVTLISHLGENSTTHVASCVNGDSLLGCPLPQSNFVPGVLDNKNSNGGGGGFSSYKGCQVSFVTPSVVFEPISVAALQSGETRNGKVEVIYGCENGANFGTATGTNALGFKVSDASKSVANAFNFKTTGTAVTKLLSERYGDSDVALGVGIDIYPKGGSVPMNWLTSSSTGGGDLNGWYLPNGHRVNSDAEPFGVYIAEYDVKLSKLPDTLGHPVTPGLVYATAELLLIVQ